MTQRQPGTRLMQAMHQRTRAAAVLTLAAAMLVVAAGGVFATAVDTGGTPAAAATQPATRPRPAAERVDPPPPRTRAEVEAVLGKDFARAGGDKDRKDPRPLRVLLVA